MSGNGYGYYYAASAQNFPVDPSQTWSEWSVEQQQYNRHVQHHNNLNHTNVTYVAPVRNQTFYNGNSRQYQQRRFSGSQTYSSGNQQQNWQRGNFSKRSRPDSSGDNGESRGKNTKKRKKPLSQNIPSKKDWTLEEADMALSVEKEYNKRYKNHSLIIKFPDLELNRDIVTNFHSSIESVHFQQPSTPRFCFVTLQETADAEAVINTLNKIKFGDGYLNAEYKKDREEDQNIGPEDIDPCTLYVGNLAQEITKEDMVKTYPNSRRIDIGYAKKMKYTRYAFVSFKNVIDSIEAFKNTHSTQMYSKSLIVRFRRLHGTVGMPGEAKPQSPAKSKSDGTSITNETICEQVNETIVEPAVAPIESNSVQSSVDLSVVKQEADSSSDDDISELTRLPQFASKSIDNDLENHRPIIKKEIKQELIDDEVSFVSSEPSTKLNYNGTHTYIKQEPSTVVKNEESEDDSSDDETGIGDVNFSSLLNQLEDHSNQIESLRKLVP